MTPKYLHADVIAGINKFHRHVLEQATRSPGLTVYHYTTSGGLLGILNQGKLRATHIAGLNDSQEYRLGVDLLRAALRLLNPTAGSAAAYMLAQALQNLDGLSIFNMPPLFVSCFTPQQDSLNQWRGYGRGEGGFAIGFDFVRLAHAANNQDAVVWPCEYAPARQAAIVADAAKQIAGLFDLAVSLNAGGVPVADLAADYLEFFFWNMSHVGPMLKHEAFHEEQEWRLVRRLADGHVAPVKIYPRADGLSGYIEMDLSETVGGRKLLPITEIIVGPSRNMELSALAVRTALRQHGYGDGVRILLSRIPFRAA